MSNRLTANISLDKYTDINLEHVIGAFEQYREIQNQIFPNTIYVEKREDVLVAVKKVTDNYYDGKDVPNLDMENGCIDVDFKILNDEDPGQEPALYSLCLFASENFQSSVEDYIHLDPVNKKLTFSLSEHRLENATQDDEILGINIKILRDICEETNYGEVVPGIKVASLEQDYVTLSGRRRTRDSMSKRQRHIFETVPEWLTRLFNGASTCHECIKMIMRRFETDIVNERNKDITVGIGPEFGTNLLDGFIWIDDAKIERKYVWDHLQRINPKALEYIETYVETLKSITKAQDELNERLRNEQFSLVAHIFKGTSFENQIANGYRESRFSKGPASSVFADEFRFLMSFKFYSGKIVETAYKLDENGDFILMVTDGEVHVELKLTEDGRFTANTLTLIEGIKDRDYRTAAIALGNSKGNPLYQVFRQYCD